MSNALRLAAEHFGKPSLMDRAEEIIERETSGLCPESPATGLAYRERRRPSTWAGLPRPSPW